VKSPFVTQLLIDRNKNHRSQYYIHKNAALTLMFLTALAPREWHREGGDGGFRYRRIRMDQARHRLALVGFHLDQ